MTAPTIRPARLADLPAAQALFESYPYKTMQQTLQRLDRARLLALYASGLERALGAGAPHWLAERDGAPLALAGLGADAFHSDVYGFKMGKVSPWLNTREPASAGGVLLAALEEAARAQEFKHLSVRLDGEDFANLHLFEAAGWYLVDISLKFSLPMPIAPASAPCARAQNEGWTVGLATPDDSDWIRRIGSQTHGGTHFLNDPALAPEKTRQLFADWLERCIEKLAYRIYVLRDAAGQGRGFVTYLRGPGFARAVGRSPIILDFVLLDPAVRGGGLGSWLIATSLAAESASGFDYCELRTSAHNLAAVNCYERLAFRLCATDFVLHRTLD